MDWIDFQPLIIIMYIMQNVSVAEARQHLSEILGKVAYGGKAFVITKKGRPMAQLMPISPTTASAKKTQTLGDIQGWLDDDDPFFKHLDMIREENRREKFINPFRTRKLKQ
jgi:prevent-host-death family protein